MVEGLVLLFTKEENNVLFFTMVEPVFCFSVVYGLCVFDLIAMMNEPYFVVILCYGGRFCLLSWMSHVLLLSFVMVGDSVLFFTIRKDLFCCYHLL